MQLLVLGGTRFAGSFLTELALEHGHDVTLVHRGESARGEFADAEHVILDRRDGHAPLAGRRFDAVVDMSGYSPAVVADSVRVLEPTVGRYLFVSSVSAYADLSQVGIDESAPLASLSPDIADVATTDLRWEVDLAHYGGLKAAAEAAVRARFGDDRTSIVRPGLIVGPRDYTDRFNYWVRRLARGGTVLAPAPATAPAQVIDARDLAAFLLHLVETDTAIVANAGGRHTSFGELLGEVSAGVDGEATLEWVDPEFLEAQGVEFWRDLPLWLPAGSGFEAMNAFDVSTAKRAGLAARSVTETARDTWVWMHEEPGHVAELSALSEEREREVLATWNRVHATQ